MKPLLARIQEEYSREYIDPITKKAVIEQFKQIEGQPDYFISNLNQCVSNKGIKPRILKPQFNKNKTGKIMYYKYMFSQQGKLKSLYCHRLVANAFLPNPLNLPEVNHLDLNKENCAVYNLKWVTKLENMSHAIRMAAWGNYIQLGHPGKKVYVYDENNNLINSFNKIVDAANVYGYSPEALNYIINPKNDRKVGTSGNRRKYPTLKFRREMI
jgi:hypothetical protein